MITVMEQCVCGNVSEPIGTDDLLAVPEGWFYLSLYFDGRVRLVVACSADCIEAARRAAIAHYEERLRGFIERIKTHKFTKAIR